MDPRLRPLWAMLALNTDLLLNCLDDLEEAEARTRPSGGNSIAFIVAHLTDTRHYLASYLEAPAVNPLAELLEGARGLEDLPQLPTLAELRLGWRTIGSHLELVGRQVSAATLETTGPGVLPGTDGSRLEGVAFLVQHDSYHLGQVALLRRQLGHSAMRYRRRPLES